MWLVDTVAGGRRRSVPGQNELDVAGNDEEGKESDEQRQKTRKRSE